MKKLALFLLLCVTIVSCGQQKTTTEVAPVTTNSGEVVPETTVELEDLGDIMSQVSEKFLENESFHTCVKQNIDNCMINISSEAESPVSMSCDEFLLESSKESCMQTEISAKAVSEKNIELCADLSSGKESCEYEVALAIGLTDFDTKVCDNITDAYKISCNNQIVINEAQTKKDVKICDKLLSENEGEILEKEFCVNEIEYIIEEDERLREEQLQEEQESIEN